MNNVQSDCKNHLVFRPQTISGHPSPLDPRMSCPVIDTNITLPVYHVVKPQTYQTKQTKTLNNQLRLSRWLQLF